MTRPDSMSAYSTTGQAFSPLRRAASISSTRCVTRSSITAKTCSTVRPEASMRRRSADLIVRVAALRSSGVLSHVGNGGSSRAASSRCWTISFTIVIVSTPNKKDSLLEL